MNAVGRGRPLETDCKFCQFGLKGIQGKKKKTNIDDPRPKNKCPPTMILTTMTTPDVKRHNAGDA